MDFDRIDDRFVVAMNACTALALFRYDDDDRCVTPLLRTGEAARVSIEEGFVDVAIDVRRLFALTANGEVYTAEIQPLSD